MIPKIKKFSNGAEVHPIGIGIWATDGSMQRNAEMWVDSIVKAARGDFENRVN